MKFDGEPLDGLDVPVEWGLKFYAGSDIHPKLTIRGQEIIGRLNEIDEENTKIKIKNRYYSIKSFDQDVSIERDAELGQWEADKKNKLVIRVLYN